MRASPGRLVASAYDPGSGTSPRPGATHPSGARLEAWYPTQLGSPETITFAGLRDVRVRITRHGGAVITATTTGGAWHLVLSR